MPLSKKDKRRFFYGNLMVAVFFGMDGLTYGVFMTAGIFFNYILAEYGWLRASMSGAYTVAYVMMGSAAVFGGRLSDRLGPRLVSVIACTAFALGHILMYWLNDLWQLYLSYGLIGGSIGAISVVLMSVIARWFIKKRGRMTGIAKVGTGLGIFAMPFLVNFLLSLYDWREAYLILGMAALVTMVPLSFVLRRDPSVANQVPDDDRESAAYNAISGNEGLSFGEAVRTWQLWLLGATFATNMLCMQVTTIHIVPHAISMGIQPELAAVLISIIGLTSILGRLAVGFTGDRIGNRRALVLCILVLVIAFSWLQAAGSLWMLYGFAILYGINHGGMVTVISPVVAEIFGTRSQGVLLGTVMFISQTAGAVGPFFAGYIFDVTGGYQTAFMVMLALAVLGLVLSTTLRPIRKTCAGN
jgi:MFS family permease